MKQTDGLKLKGFRVQNRYSQRELGAIVSRSARTVCYWEKDEVKIPVEIKQLLNKTFGLNLILK